MVEHCSDFHLLNLITLKRISLPSIESPIGSGNWKNSALLWINETRIMSSLFLSVSTSCSHTGKEVLLGGYFNLQAPILVFWMWITRTTSFIC